MADFVQKSITKTAVRNLTTPIADAATFAAIPASVISTNPFGCTSYEVGGVTIVPVVNTKESYGARILYQDDDGKTIGTLTLRAPSTAAFATVKSEVLGDAEMTAAGYLPIPRRDAMAGVWEHCDASVEPDWPQRPERPEVTSH